jgi:uncharacterized alpha-E superfamily protein
VDLRDMAPGLMDKQWRSILAVMGVDESALPAAPEAPLSDRVSAYMTLHQENPHSLLTCLTRARENARGIREGISSEMWEHLNQLYWTIHSEEARTRFAESPHELYKDIISGAMSFHGLTDQTLPHEQRWHFTQLGRYFERITFTCRLLAQEFATQSSSPADLPFRNLQGSTILRACNSHEANRRTHPGELESHSVAAFLLLEPFFPRSVTYCVRHSKASISAISAEVRQQAGDPAERILARLLAQLEYADPADIASAGIDSHLARILEDIGRAAIAIQASYFLH